MALLLSKAHSLQFTIRSGGLIRGNQTPKLKVDQSTSADPSNIKPFYYNIQYFNAFPFNLYKPLKFDGS